MSSTIVTQELWNRGEPAQPGREGPGESRDPSRTPTVRTGASPPDAGASPLLFTRGELVAERFWILGVLGSGGGGQVFEAEDLLLGRRVALKAIHPELASDSAALERLRAEVLLARQVTDPHVCRIFDVSRHELRSAGAGAGPAETLVAVMEWLEGETLARRLRSGRRLSEDEVARIAEQVARGLAAAHAAGVLHLDLKSANILLTRYEEGVRAVITDFGLAVSIRPDGTRAAARGGTPGYMAPEQRRGEPSSPAMDVYAFGCVLHEMLTGRLPEAGGRVDHRRLPRRWRALVASFLAERPADRPPDGTAVLRQVSRLAGPAEERSRARRVAGAAAAAALGLLLLSLETSTPAGAGGRPEPAPPADPLLGSVAARPAAAQELQAGLRALRRLDGRRAQELLASAVRREPGSAVAHALLSEAWEELGYSERARDAAHRGAALSADSEGARLFVEARRLETERVWTEASERRRTLHAFFPDNPEHAVRRIEVHLAAGAAEEADQVLTALRQRAPAGLEPLLWLLDAKVARVLGKGERQLQSARRAIGTARALGQPGVAARGLLLESEALRRLGRDDQGRAATESAYRLFGALDNDGGRMTALAQLAVLESEVSGAADRATAASLEALRLARELGNASSEAHLLDLRGSEALHAGDPDRAEERYRQAREIYRRLRNEEGMARTTGNLALVQMARGDFAAAEREFEEAVRLRRRTGPPLAAAQLLNNLGTLYARRGEGRRARDTWTEAERLAREGGNRFVSVLAAFNLAELALESGNLVEASTLLEGVAPGLEALATPALSVEMWLLRGRIAFYRGDHGAAVKAATRARSILEQLRDPTGAAQVRLQLAALRTAQGRFDSAEALAREAVQRLEAVGNESILALGRYRLLCAILGQGRLAEAGKLLEQFGDGSAAGQRDDLHRVFLEALARARYHLAAGDPDTAIAKLEAALAQLPHLWLVPYRFEARLLLAAAEEARSNRGESSRLLRELAADAERGGFAWFGDEARRRLGPRQRGL